jgi:Domain of unknown function (DUF5011)
MKKQILTALSLTLVAGALVFTSCKKSDDTSAPIVTVTGSTDVLSILNVDYTDPGATAKDDKDATVSVTSDFSTVFNKNLAGTYKITYTATDAAGNAGTGVRFIEVYNEAKAFSGTYRGTEVATDSSYGTITPSTTVNGRFTIAKFGTYKSAIVTMKFSGGVITMDPTPQTITITRRKNINGVPTDVISNGVKFETTGAITGTSASFVVPYKETATLDNPVTTSTATTTYIKQ